MTNPIEFEDRIFVPAEEAPVPEWPCVLGDRPQPTLTLKDDDLFLITDNLGNITGCLQDDRPASLGLFCKDTRFLSRLELQIEGRPPLLLSSDASKGFALSVLCSNPRINDRNLKAETIGIQREIVLNGALFEEIKITNYCTTAVAFEISLSFDADFVDLFEIRGFAREKQGQLLRLMPADPALETEQFTPNTHVVLAYQGLDGSFMESRIQFVHRPPDQLKGYTAVWKIELEPHVSEHLGYRLQMLINSAATSKVHAPLTLMQAKAAEFLEEQQWQQSVTQIRSDNKAFNQIIEQAERDIYLLRQTFFGAGKVLAAGVPWFSTLFGRDSIIAASQTLILDPSIARETLLTLAEYQGKTEDDWRDEEPGKILHEIRYGEMARCNEVPHTPYYGTVDATPLWLMLYAEYYVWTQDSETMERLWPNALAAMDWIDRNCQETGYLRYACRSKRGLVNQGWKDSDDCIVRRDGMQASGPIALCEVQAYVYAAKVRLAEIARTRKEYELSERWLQQAKELKARFNRDFWVTDLDFCAIALDGDGQQIDGITSNPGQCLHLGIFTPEKAQSVAERLQAPDMFNGWGIRTLSSLSPAYNPMGYHTGSVWPHDNALIALGLRSHGFVEQSLEIAAGLIDMTRMQPYQRPPELFCGYERINGNAPVRYPVACSPQAWATGSIFQLLQMMVNLVPDAPGNYLRILEPVLLPTLNQLSLHNLRVGTTLIDLEFERVDAITSCRVTKKRGNLRVVIEA